MFLRDQYPRDYAILKAKDLTGISKLLRELVLIERKMQLSKRYKAISFECKNVLKKELSFSLDEPSEKVQDKNQKKTHSLTEKTGKTYTRR